MPSLSPENRRLNKLADLVLTALKKAPEDGKAVRYPIPLEKVKNKINNEKTSMSRGNSLTSFLGLDDNVATSSGSGSVSRDDSSGTNLKKRPRSYVEDDDEDDDDGQFDERKAAPSRRRASPDASLSLLL